MNEADAESMLGQFKSWVNGRGAAKLLSDALAEWTAWRKPLPQGLALCTDDEKKLWRQSEAVLRMGQVRQPNTASRKNYGMVLASLPPGEWHTGWVRDGMYAIVALARMGHHAEAKLALDFMLNAEPTSKYSSYVSGASYQVSVCRYFGTGEEEADYSGQQTPNIETDGWGMTLWAARQYVEASGDTAWLAEKTRKGVTIYDTLYSGVAEALRKNTEPSGIAKADSSIWEVHDENKKHFAYTTLATIRGFCDFAQLASKAGKSSDAPPTEASRPRRGTASSPRLSIGKAPSPGRLKSWPRTSPSMARSSSRLPGTSSRMPSTSVALARRRLMCWAGCGSRAAASSATTTASLPTTTTSGS
jgi:GH15 family glucan-1,4-alpha-glucosidase